MYGNIRVVKLLMIMKFARTKTVYVVIVITLKTLTKTYSNIII